MRKKVVNMLGTGMILTIALCLFTSNAYTQMPQQAQPQQQEVSTDFSDDELEQWVDAAQEVMTIQQESQQEMVEEIQSEDLTIDEFNELFEAMQNPEVEMQASNEEQEAFDRAMQKVNEVQSGVEEKVMDAVEDAGLTYQEYEQIMMAYQQSPEVQERVNQIMQP